MEEFKERREHRRLRIQLPLRIRGFDREGKGIDLRGATENMSTGGVYYVSTSLLQPGMNLNISLSIPYEVSHVFSPRSLETEATVVRLIELDGAPQMSKGITVPFLRGLKLRIQEFEDS